MSKSKSNTKEDKEVTRLQKNVYKHAMGLNIMDFEFQGKPLAKACIKNIVLT